VRDYVFYPSNDVGPASCIDEETGARFAHSDRVITDGIGVLLMSEQPKEIATMPIPVRKNSLAYRLEERKKQKQKDKENRRYIY